MFLRHYRKCIRDLSTRTFSFTERAISAQTPLRIAPLSRAASIHPPHNLNKDQLLQLKSRDLRSLFQKRPENNDESDMFYMNLLDIIHDSILTEPQRAARFLQAAQGTKYERVLFDSLREFYKSDPLRWSIVAFIEAPTDRKNRKLIMSNLVQILADANKSSEEAALTALNYLRRLASTDVPNPKSFILLGSHSSHLVNSLPVHKRDELFGVMVNINMRFGNGNIYHVLKNHLLKGNQLQRLVARTGLLGVKWPDVAKTGISEKHRQKMLFFYSIDDLIFFAKTQIQKKDVVYSNLYLELMVSKFEMMDDASHLQKVLDILIIHSMKFKGPQECIKFLRYILVSKLQVTTSTLTKILVELTQQGCYDEALLLVNYMYTEPLSENQKSYLVREIVKIICGKFSEHPKVSIGYFASLFGNAGLKVLQNLSLLEILYSQARSDPSFSFIEKADIHEDLKDSCLTHSIIKDVYTSILHSLPSIQSSSPVLIKKLYDSYRDQVLKYRQDPSSVFYRDNIDDSIVTLLVEFLLKKNPHERESFKLVRDTLRYETAKAIAQDFLAQTKLGSRKVYLFEILITSSLQQHHDLSFAVSLIKYAKDLNLPLTFNQIYPFIVFHYSRGAPDQALKWYTLLVQSGVKSNHVDGDELVRIAKELDWPVKGTSVQQAVRRKNRKARQEQRKLEEETIFKVTKKDTVNRKEGGFLHELGLILSDAAYAKTHRELQRSFE